MDPTWDIRALVHVPAPNTRTHNGATYRLCNVAHDGGIDDGWIDLETFAQAAHISEKRTGEC